MRAAPRAVRRLHLPARAQREGVGGRAARSPVGALAGPRPLQGRRASPTCSRGRSSPSARSGRCAARATSSGASGTRCTTSPAASGTSSPSTCSRRWRRPWGTSMARTSRRSRSSCATTTSPRRRCSSRATRSWTAASSRRRRWAGAWCRRPRRRSARSGRSRCCAGSRRAPWTGSSPAASSRSSAAGSPSSTRTSCVARPPSLVRLFATADREQLDLYPYARDLAAQAAEELPPEAASDPELNQELLAVLHAAGDARPLPHAHARDRRAAAGAAGVRAHHGAAADRRLPRVHGRRSHAVRGAAPARAPLRRREGGRARRAHAGAVQRPLALYLGTLFHDIGKGCGKDHSARGAEIAAEACVRMGIDPADAADVEWLVAKHLRMSAHRAAARPLRPRPHPRVRRGGRDERPARQALPPHLRGHRHRRSADLDRLEGAGSSASSTRRRARCSRRGERAAGAGHAPRRRGASASPRRSARAPPSRTRSRRPLRARPCRRATSSRSLPAQAPRHLRLLAHGAAICRSATALRHGAALGYSELSLTARDRPGLLAHDRRRPRGAPDRHPARRGLLDAGRSRPAAGSPGVRSTCSSCAGRRSGAVEPARWRAARADLASVLAGAESLEALLARRLRASLAPGEAAPARADEDRHRQRQRARTLSVVDVFTADRVGLLHTLARTFFELGLSVDLARISTEGHRASDAFYVRDRQRARCSRAIGRHRVVAALTAALTRPDRG